MNSSLITLENCSISRSLTEKPSLTNISWSLKTGESWLFIGPNGEGKEDFLKALTGEAEVIPESVSENHTEKIGGLFSNVFKKSVCVVSLEKAAALIAEERERDEGDYIEGGIDIGRTPRTFIGELFGLTSQAGGKSNDSNVSPANKRLIERMENLPEVKLCGIQNLLDRGLKYLSTGEIRRTLLCKALLSGERLLILSDPFAGLDVESRKILSDFFNTIAIKQAMQNTENHYGNRKTDLPVIILCMDRFFEIPNSINRVLEIRKNKITYNGERSKYQQFAKERLESLKNEKETNRKDFLAQLGNLHASTVTNSNLDSSIPLVKMEDVKVAWGDHTVLNNLNWTLLPGEHTLIRGPNGSGKTTLLELITGDNMQVFSNKVSLFGRQRGTGETIWELKEKMGIVSYRLHLEYRMVGGTDLEAVILSGFHDSIGLYEQRSQVEQLVAKKWLALAGFEGREHDTFSSLSYGEQRAILIIRAAVKCPPLLILDEPCHGLDDSYREKILDLLETIAATGTTTLLHVTHDATEILSCEKHIFELKPNQNPMYQLIKS